MKIETKDSSEAVLLSPLERLPLNEAAVKVIQVVTRSNFRILVAGGAVRDLMMGMSGKDIDLCSDATPKELIAILRSQNITVIPVGQSFGVVIAVIEGEQIEIATFRTDGDYSDGRRPDDVSFVRNPAQDAVRRDLTINGLFYNPEDHTIIDYVGGIEDMKKEVLRFIGNPYERINEDKLRMLRYVRFLLKTGFISDEVSEQAIKENAPLIKVVSAERIKDEVEKMFKVGPVSKALQLLKKLNLLQYILPEVDVLSECDQNSRHHLEGDVFTHTCMVVDALPENIPMTLIWAAVLHDIGKPLTKEFTTDQGGSSKCSFKKHDAEGAKLAEVVLRRLKFPNKERDEIEWLIQNHQQIFLFPEIKASRAKRFALNSDLTEINPWFESLITLCEADFTGRISGTPREIDPHAKAVDGLRPRLQLIKEDLAKSKETSIKDFINGKDVMSALGLKKGGPQVGKLLGQVQDELLELSADQCTRKKALSILDGLTKEIIPS